MTPILSWDTFITSCSAAPGWAFFAALLYWFPEDVRQNVQRKDGGAFLDSDFHRLQHALFRHAGPGLHGHAAAVLHAPAAVPHRPCHCFDRHLLSWRPGWFCFSPISWSRCSKGRKAEQNPWGGVTLEWQIPTPPPLENFSVIPDDQGASLYFQSGGFPMSSPAAASRILRTKTTKAPNSGCGCFCSRRSFCSAGCFILYSAYRARYPLDFHDGGQHLNVVIGVANTIILLTSSLTVALSITAIQKGNRRLSICMPGGPRLFSASLFLVNKYIEWSGGNSPRPLSQFPGIAAAPARRSDLLRTLLQHDRVARTARHRRHPAAVDNAGFCPQGKSHKRGFQQTRKCGPLLASGGCDLDISLAAVLSGGVA